MCEHARSTTPTRDELAEADDEGIHPPGLRELAEPGSSFSGLWSLYFIFACALGLFFIKADHSSLVLLND